jgi:hypothetical protein
MDSPADAFAVAIAPEADYADYLKLAANCSLVNAAVTVTATPFGL